MEFVYSHEQQLGEIFLEHAHVGNIDSAIGDIDSVSSAL